MYGGLPGVFVCPDALTADRVIIPNSNLRLLYLLLPTFGLVEVVVVFGSRGTFGAIPVFVPSGFAPVFLFCELANRGTRGAILAYFVVPLLRRRGTRGAMLPLSSLLLPRRRGILGAMLHLYGCFLYVELVFIWLHTRCPVVFLPIFFSYDFKFSHANIPIPTMPRIK